MLTSIQSDHIKKIYDQNVKFWLNKIVYYGIIIETLSLFGGNTQMNPEKFFDVFLAYVEKSGTKYIEIARAIGVSPATITMMKRGSKPKFKTFVEITKFLNRKGLLKEKIEVISIEKCMHKKSSTMGASN